MRKVLFIVLLLICALQLYSVEFEIIIEFGIIPWNMVKYYDFTSPIYNIGFYGDFQFTTIIRRLSFGVSSKIYIWKLKKGITFQPDNILFLFFSRFNINDNILIGFRHLCQHPIKSWDTEDITILEQFFDEFYIQFKFNINRN